MGVLVARLVSLGLSTGIAWTLAHLGVDPGHVDTAVNSQGKDTAGAALDKLLGQVLQNVLPK